ncbi:MAG: hypothetical protein L0312_16190 [Acidobacteria bacterium]|nr:hypothetical protein [Acidobacteriota bacterium]
MNKHLRLDQAKIQRARKILSAKTETETIHQALDRVIQSEATRLQRKRIVRQMLRLRSRLGKMPEPSSEWIREARRERTGRYDRRA